jgi:hypothetical protein
VKDYKNPLYSQKHYEDTTFDLKNDIYTSAEKKAIMGFLIHLFSKNSSKFDINKFIKACGE